MVSWCLVVVLICLFQRGTASFGGMCVFCNSVLGQQLTPETDDLGWKKFDIQTFNSLQDVHDVMVAMEDKEKAASFEHWVGSAGQMIVKHGMQEYVGVARLHKHFDLRHGEKMVFMQNTTTGMIKGAPMLKKEIDQLSCTIVPYMFQLGYDNQWYPLQYYCDDQDIRSDGLEKLHTLSLEGTLNDMFQDIRDVIVAFQARDHIGVYYRYVSTSPEDAEINAASFMLEKTYHDRSQTFEFTAGINANDLGTQYYFDDTPCLRKSTSNNHFAFLDDDNSQLCISVPPASCNRYCEWGPFKGHVTYHAVS